MLISYSCYSQTIDHYLSESNIFYQDGLEKVNYEKLYVSLVHSEDSELIGLSLSPIDGSIDNMQTFKMSIKDIYTHEGTKYFVFDCKLIKNQIESSKVFTVYVTTDYTNIIIFYSESTYQGFQLNKLVSRDNL